MDKVERHNELCETLNAIYATKNQAYGDSFGKTFEELGIISAITRMSDKWNRIVNLAKNRNISWNDERIEDTLMDLANYCLMTVMEIENEQD